MLFKLDNRDISNLTNNNISVFFLNITTTPFYTM